MTTIHVTQKHIDEGRVKDCRECPVALALLDVLRAGLRVSVYFGISIDDGVEVLQRFDMHEWKIGEFVADFDMRKGVHPLSFDLDIKQELLREAA